MNTSSLHQWHLTFRADALSAGALLVTGFRVREEISTPHTIDVDLVPTGSAAVAPSSLLRKGASVDVHARGELVRRFEGIVTSVRERFAGGGSAIGVTIASPLALLALSNDYRIYQGKTTRKIVEGALSAVGVPDEHVEWRLRATYAPREVCTQYGETTLAFVSRILEEDGVFFFATSDARGMRLVIGDSPLAHPVVQPEARIAFRQERGLSKTAAIETFSKHDRLRPSSVTLRDHDWKKPALELSATSETRETKRPVAREDYDYEARGGDPGELQARAGRQLEAIVAAAAEATGTGTAAGLSAGHTFSLTGAPDARLDTEWLVVAVDHTWDVSPGGCGYRNAFRVLAKATPFRPPARAPRPTVRGPQTAIVTGPAGQEIHTDEHGRVKLKFPWDRHAGFDEKSSGWARVAQLAMGGSMAIPRIGWEVVVEFEGGSPDRPIVIGRVYNGAYRPPYPLPEKKAVSSLMSWASPGGSGHNEIRFDDTAGSEHVHVHAQRDFTVDVARNRRARVGASEMLAIAASDAVRVDDAQTVDVGGISDVTVGGAQRLQVEASRRHTVKKDDRLTVNGERALEVGEGHTLTLDGSYMEKTGKDATTSVARGLTERIAGTSRELVGGDRAVSVAASLTETVATGKLEHTDGARASTIAGARTLASGGDVAIQAGGTRTTTVGAALSVTAGANVVLSARDALEIQVAGALACTGTTRLVLKVGSSRVSLSPTGVVIDAQKVRVVSDGPTLELAALVVSK